jgi:tRNA threonylcarbamoyladenosine biosynthesis protein TsaE
MLRNLSPQHKYQTFLTTLDDTTRLGVVLANVLTSGDCLLLNGPVGAGKSHLARAIIRSLLPNNERHLDIPSPTFTLVQVYDTLKGAVWHADLYRLTDADEVFELGLDAAFESEITLIEWPERLGTDTPENALTITLAPQLDGRQCVFDATDPKWIERLDALEMSP